jgi:hypothetical protein
MRWPTRRFSRLVLVAVAAAAGPVLSACDSLDALDVFDTKKKLAGERKEVFPDGVPGVTSGIPPDLVKGYREPEGGGLDPAKVAAEAAAETAAAKPAKPKPDARQPDAKPAPQRTASKAVAKQKQQAQPDPSAAPTRAAAPEPAQPQPAQAAAPAPWPAVQPQAAWPASQGNVAH